MLIQHDKEILGGIPVFYGMRVPVQNLIDYLATGERFRIERVLAPFPEAFAEAAYFNPRLIDLAVGKLNYEPPDEILRELRTLSHDVDEALNEMIRKTAEQMEAHDPGATLTLRRLAVCRGGFTWEAAQAISGLDNDPLIARMKTLIDYRFVRLKDDRYSIDDLVRLAVGEDEDARRTHFDYYKALAHAIGGDQTKHDRYQRLAIESENLDAAFALALVVNSREAVWLANDCFLFLTNRGRFSDLMTWFTALGQKIGGYSRRTNAGGVLRPPGECILGTSLW